MFSRFRRPVRVFDRDGFLTALNVHAGACLNSATTDADTDTDSGPNSDFRTRADTDRNSR